LWPLLCILSALCGYKLLTAENAEKIGEIAEKTVHVILKVVSDSIP